MSLDGKSVEHVVIAMAKSRYPGLIPWTNPTDDDARPLKNATFFRQARIVTGRIHKVF
jgi:hypothetical protein